MKFEPLRRFLACVLVFSSFFVIPAAAQEQAPAAAEEQPSTRQVRGIQVKLAIIDIGAISRESAAAKDIRRQVLEYRNAVQGANLKDEEEMRLARQELTRQSAILSPEAYAEERRKFEERLVEVQRLFQERRQAWEESSNKAWDQFTDALHTVVKKLASEQSLTLILRKEQVVFWATLLDITNVVLQRLDDVLPSVEVPEPGTP